MSLSSVYPVALCNWRQTSVRLPVHVAPGTDEALSSWLCRLGYPAGLSPQMLVRRSFGIDPRANREWWRRPSAAHLAVISDKTGISPSRLQGMTLKGWACARGDENPPRLRPTSITHGGQTAKHLWFLGVCRLCLVEDEAPYLRREWMLGWSAVCRWHGAVLSTKCPSCQIRLRAPNLNANVAVEIGRCRRCDAELSGSVVEYAPEAVPQLQEAMLTIKRAGTGEMPGLGRIDWETLVALIDLILSVVWIETVDYARERLFAEIVRDLDLAAESRLKIAWPTNYGTLVLLAWLFGAWGERLNKLLTLLQSPVIDVLVARFGNLTPRLNRRLRNLWVDTSPARLPRKEATRMWLDSLPRTAAELRERARHELHSGRNARIVALAMLRDGKRISTAAAMANVQRATVQRWLDIGMGYGLEAIFVVPLRRCDLTSEHLQKIEEWIATIRRSTSGLGAWRPEHAQQEIAARFGLLISVDAVHALFSKHRTPRRRPVRISASASPAIPEPVHELRPNPLISAH